MLLKRINWVLQKVKLRFESGVIFHMFICGAGSSISWRRLLCHSLVRSIFMAAFFERNHTVFSSFLQAYKYLNCSQH
jgi:hypothetical protein